jgi:uncharacterized protein (DUF2126 family)
MASLSFKIVALKRNLKGLAVSNWRTFYSNYKTLSNTLSADDLNLLLIGKSIVVRVDDDHNEDWIIKSAHNTHHDLIDWSNK